MWLLGLAHALAALTWATYASAWTGPDFVARLSFDIFFESAAGAGCATGPWASMQSALAFLGAAVALAGVVSALARTGRRAWGALVGSLVINTTVLVAWLVVRSVGSCEVVYLN